MDLIHIGFLVLALLAGAIAFLKIYAPKTANKTDDAVLARLEALEKLMAGLLQPKDPPPQ